MQKLTVINAMAILLFGTLALYADDPIIPGANLGKSSTLPPPPSSVAPRPDPATNTNPQLQHQSDPAKQNRDAITDPVPGYQGGPYVRGGNQYWLPNNVVPQVGSPYYYSATQGAGGTYGMTAPRVGIRAGQSWCAGNNEANVGMQNQGLSGGDPYTKHFGPGFYRSNEYGHYRFPSYSYRRPWYNPGAPTYNRDTNFRW